MIKTKLFDMGHKNSDEINEWLEQNPYIAILSTNSFSNQAGWGYIILYDDIKPQHSTLPVKEGEIFNDLA
jgi:hypothetical protein